MPSFSEFQETFNLFDNRGHGKIYVYQLGEALRAMGQNPTEQEVRKCASGYSQDPGKYKLFAIQFQGVFCTFSASQSDTVKFECTVTLRLR